MIHPTNIDTLTSLLKPAKGYLFEYGIFTTYSLHLDLILTLPMYLTNAENNSTKLPDNYGHIVDMVDAYKDKMKVFVQAGQMKTSSLAKGKSSKLYGLLNDMIVEIKPKAQSSFHPKFWLLKYKNDEKTLYRLVILSKNLTNSKDWDIVASFDGEVIEPLEDNINNNIITFLEYLNEKSSINFDAQEIRSIKWDKDINGLSFEDIIFLGIGNSNAKEDIKAIKEKSKIIFSPFFSKSIVDKSNLKLITIESEIKDRFTHLKDIYTLAFDSVQIEEKDSNKVTKLSADLHAKIYIFQHRSTYIYIGSSNASHSGLDNKNIEVLIKLKGNYDLYNSIEKEYFGDKSKLLKCIDTNNISDDVLNARALSQKIEEKLREVKELIINSDFILNYDDEKLMLKNEILILPVDFTLKVSPVSIVDQKDYAKNIVWSTEKVIDFSPFFHFYLSYKELNLEFVLKFDIDDFPSEYADEIKSYADRHSSRFFYENIKSLLATNNLTLISEGKSNNLKLNDEDKEEKFYYKKKNIHDDILDLLMLTYGTNKDTFCKVVNKILKYKKSDEELSELKSILKSLGAELCKK